MIEITYKYIIDGKLDKEALATLGADLVEVEGDEIIFKTDVKFEWCDSLTSVAGVTFNGIVEFYSCNSLTSVEGATFNDYVWFWSCYSLASVSGAIFKRGFEAELCHNLKNRG